MRAHVACGAALVASLFARGARADFAFPNFGSTAGLNLVGTAGATGGALRLTGAASSLGGTWFQTRQRVLDGFDTTFTIRYTGRTGSGASGLAFVIQNSGGTAIGSPVGCGMGYQNIVAPGASCVAIEFDSRRDQSCGAGEVEDPDDAHVSVHTRQTASIIANESTSIGVARNVAALRGDAPIACRVRYVPGTIEVYVGDLVTPAAIASMDLSATLGTTNSAAFVGFTSATPDDGSQNTDVLSWSFDELDPLPPGPPFRPGTPVIIEPSFDGRQVNGYDVHMEASPNFQDGDGNGHLSTDWEIWAAPPTERVWHAHNVTGASKVHIHLGDGTFENSHQGRFDLIFDRNYIVRCRFRDDSGDPATEWSHWSNRQVRTILDRVSLPLDLDDVARMPVPVWKTDAGDPVVLPAVADGQTPASVLLGSTEGQVLLKFVGEVTGRTPATIANPQDLGVEVHTRISVVAGDAELVVPPSTIRLFDHHCVPVTIYLPAIELLPGERQWFWVWENGSTFYARPDQEHPDFSTLMRNSDVPWIGKQAGFEVDVFARDFQLPDVIAMIPNPGPLPTDILFYVAELYGNVKAVTRDGTVSTYATGLLNFNPFGNFPGSGELGIGGLCVEPTTGDLFVTMLYEIPGTGLYPRLQRLHSADGGRTMQSRTTVVEFPTEPMGASHQISHVAMNPDGSLMVHMGDGFDITKGQDLNSVRGKTLRMQQNGQPDTRNTFYNANDGITARDYVYTYGHRNPFGGGLRLSSNTLYTSENGPAIDRFAALFQGTNYRYDGTEDSMRTFAIYNWIPSHAPVQMCFIENGRFGGSGFPAGQQGSAFVAESGPTFAAGRTGLGKRIIEIRLTPDGLGLGGLPRTLVEYNGIGRATVVAVASGPDGLYFTDFYKDVNLSSPIDRGARVLRVRYVEHDECTSPCAADFDGNGTVDFFDYLDFVNAFSLERADADFDGNDTIDFFDYLDFVMAFDEAC
jgi:hypothetical protein